MNLLDILYITTMSCYFQIVDFNGFFIQLTLILFLATIINGQTQSIIGIQELSHDFALKKLNPDKVQKIQALFDTSINYQFRIEQIPNTTIRYFLSKPWRLRIEEYFHDYHDYGVKILHQHSQIKFERVTRVHEGLYSLYQFYFDNTNQPKSVQYQERWPKKRTNGRNIRKKFIFNIYNDNDDDWHQNLHFDRQLRLVNYTRRDFNLVVNG